MRELRFRPITLVRAVAGPGTIDLLEGAAGGVWRLAADEALIETPSDSTAVLSLTGARPDPHAIVEPDPGWAVASLGEADFEVGVERSLEWSWPDRGGTAQGLLHNVPVKIRRVGAGQAGVAVSYRMLCPLPMVHELEERLGWSR